MHQEAQYCLGLICMTDKTINKPDAAEFITIKGMNDSTIYFSIKTKITNR